MEGFFRTDETKRVREVAVDRGRSTIGDLSPAERPTLDEQWASPTRFSTKLRGR
jgi:hypothetical protein